MLLQWVGHALIVREQVVEDEAELQRADALLQAADVAALELVAQAVHNLLERLHPPGEVQVVLREGADSDGDDLADGRFHHVQLMLRLRRKGDVLLMQLAAGLRDVERVVGDTLKVRDRMQELRDILVLPGRAAHAA